MKTKIFYTLLLAVGILVVSCKDDFLQDGTIPADGDVTEEQFWNHPDWARNYLNNIYSHVEHRFNLLDNWSLLADASDEAISSNLNSSISIFNNGTWSPVRTVDDVWTDMYAGIRKTNIFLEKIKTANIVPMNGLTYDEDLKRMRGQAFFLRGFFLFELVKRYGSAVIVTRELNPDENLNLPRNSFDECVQQIVLDCDSAIARLPVYTKDWLIGDPNNNPNTSNYGRATQTAAMALKARILLYAASPQYNPTNDLTKWQAAANAAKAIMDLNKHSLFNNYANIWLWSTAANQYNNEVIFASQTYNGFDFDQNNAPVSYDGALGRTNPTQELVDAFEMKTTGRPISDPLSGYSDANPYTTNRDPRLALAIMYNGQSFKNATVETFIGGKDGIGVNVNATKTGYYLRKFIDASATWNTSSNTSRRRPWVIFRYAEVLLNYAEALNEAQGVAAATQVLGAINQIRARAGVAMPALQTTNPLGNGYVALTKEAIRARIRNERRVELCFEEQRFYDVRRWKEGEIYFNKPITGMRITKNANGTFNYERFTVENRVFTEKNYLFPISQNELNRAPALGQNKGYN